MLSMPTRGLRCFWTSEKDYDGTIFFSKKNCFKSKKGGHVFESEKSSKICTRKNCDHRKNSAKIKTRKN